MTGVVQDRPAAAGSGVRELAEDEGWALLRSTPTARLAVCADDGPDVFPVTITVDRGSVVFRTGTGRKLAATRDGQPVALEADGTVADAAGPGMPCVWSVVLRGHATQVTGSRKLLDTATLPLTPWQAGTKGRFVRVTGRVSGRWFPLADPATWRPPPGVRPVPEDA